MPASAGSLFVNIRARTAGLKSGLRSAQRSVQRTARKMERAGRTITTAVTLPLAAAGGAAVKFAADMDNSLAQARAQAGLTAEAIDRISDSAEEVAITTGQSFESVVEAFKFARSAGLDMAESQEIVETAAKAAAAGFGDQTTLLRGMTTVMAGMGDEVGSSAEIMDKMVATAQSMEVRVPALTEVMGQLVQVSSEVGVSFDEMLAAVGSVGEQFGDVKRAGNLMATAMTQLLDPSQEARDLMKQVGTSAEALKRNIEQKGITRAMSDLRARTEEAGIEFARMVGSARSARVMLALTTQEGQRVAEIMEDARNSTGALNDAFKNSESFSRLLAKAWQSLRVSLRPLGQAIIQTISPAIESLMTKVRDLSHRFQMMSKQTRATALAAFTLAGALGPIVFIGGKMLTAIAGLIGVLGTTGGLAAALGAAALASKEFRTRLIRIGSELVTRISRAWQEFGPKIKSTLSEALGSAVKIFQEFSVAALQATDALLQFLTGNWKESWNSIVRATKTATTSILEELDKLETKTKAIVGGIGLLVAAFSGGWVPAILGAGTATASLASILGDSSSKAQEAMKTWGQFQKELGVTREEMLALGRAVDATRKAGIIPEFRSLKEVLKPGEAAQSVENFIQRIKGAWQSFRSQFMGGPGGGGGGRQEIPTAGVESNVQSEMPQPTSAQLAMLGVPPGEIERLKQKVNKFWENFSTGSQTATKLARRAVKQLVSSLSRGFQEMMTALLGFGRSSTRAEVRVLRLQDQLQQLKKKDPTPLIQKRMELLRDRLEEARAATKPVVSAFKNMARGIIQALTGVIAKLAAVAGIAAIINVVTGGTAGFLGGAKGFGGIFSKLLQFQHGGLVTGPTIGMVGEGPGTSASNPEVVAPLDKLKNMIGGGGEMRGSIRTDLETLRVDIARNSQFMGR